MWSVPRTMTGRRMSAGLTLISPFIVLFLKASDGSWKLFSGSALHRVRNVPGACGVNVAVRERRDEDVPGDFLLVHEDRDAEAADGIRRDVPHLPRDAQGPAGHRLR